MVECNFFFFFLFKTKNSDFRNVLGGKEVTMNEAFSLSKRQKERQTNKQTNKTTNTFERLRERERMSTVVGWLKGRKAVENLKKK